MTPTPPARTRADVLALADQYLADATEHYLTLSDPQWKIAGSTSTEPRSDRRATKVHAGPPANLDVLDYLALAESEVADLAGEILGLTGGHGDAHGDGAEDHPDTIDAFRVLRERLDVVPDTVAAEVAAAAWRLSRAGRRLLGSDGGPRPLRMPCVRCHRAAVVAHPTEPGAWACGACGNRTTHNPSPAHE